jgi:electron transfer flavoprotein beta subunit
MRVAMRKILVGIKRVVDYNVRIRVRADGSGVSTEGLKMSINPFDEIALEEALRIKERGQADEVVVVSIGGREVEQQLRAALAMGADRAVLVESAPALEPLAVARGLLAIVAREQPLLVLLGKQAVDDDQNQTGQMLAALWQRPQATFASSVILADATATVTREVDDGLETLEIDLPGVVTVDLRLNQPRYVKLPDILKAKRKPFEVIEVGALDVAVAPQFRVVHTAAPSPRPRGVIVRDAAELVAELRRRGVL